MIENNSNDTDVKCQLDSCKTYPAITDSERGEIFCGGCGLVIVQNMADYSQENYSSDNMKSVRTGPATSLTMFDQGLSTIIGTNKDSTGKTIPGKTKGEFKITIMGSKK